MCNFLKGKARLLFAALLLGLSFSLHAADPIKGVELNGFFYDLDPDTHTATFTYDPSIDWSDNHAQSYTDEEIVIPEVVIYEGEEYTVTKLDRISRCNNLKTLKMPNTITAFNIIEDCPKLTDIVWSEGILRIEESGISFLDGLISLVLPPKVKYVSMYGVFCCEALRYLEIPASVEEFGAGAFGMLTNLQEVKIADSKTALHFRRPLSTNDTQYEILYLGRTVTYDDQYGNPFSLVTSIKTVTIGSDVTALGDSLLCRNQELETVRFKGAPAEISSTALPACVRYLHVDNANDWCAAGLQVPVIATRGDLCVGDTRVENLNLTPSGRQVAPHTFANTSVVTARITADVIGESAFSGSAIKALCLDVKTINTNAFASCADLTTVYSLSSTPPSAQADAFAGCSGVKLYVPVGAAQAYAAAAPWSGFTIEESDFSDIDRIFRDRVVDANGFYYTIDPLTMTAEVTDGDVRYHGNVVIPSVVTYGGKDYSVTSVGSEAFSGCTALTSVTIPATVTAIGDNAFAGCDNITSITIPATVRTVGESAFENCSHLASVQISEGVTDISDNAFKGCAKLTEVVIPNSVATIGSGAFAGCTGIADLVIGGGVKSIGEGAFADSGKLTTVLCPDAVDLAATPGVFPSTTVIRPYPAGTEIKKADDGSICTVDDKTLIYVPAGKTSYEIPSTVTTIGEGAFSDCATLTSVTIPEGVTAIGDGAFEGCAKLTDVKLPDSLTEIGDNAFKGCEAITAIKIPESVESIGSGAFADCSGIKDIEIPESVKEIGADAFAGCTGLSTVEIPEGVTEIGPDAFTGCTDLTHVTIPESVTSIGADAFKGCENLTEITIPEGVTELGDNAFAGCKSLTEIVIPGNVETIGAGAFEGCEGLTNVTIPESVTTIGDNAFKDCAGLTEVVIPAGITEIGENAFSGCKSLTEVVIPGNVGTIGAGAFEGCEGLTSVTIPESVTTIGDNAFKDCAGITDVVIPAGVTEVGAGAFEGCEGLVKGAYPASLGDNPFPASVGNPISYPAEAETAPDGTISTPDKVYYVPVTAEGSYELAETVIEIGAGSFAGCKDVTSVTIPDGVISIGDNAFKGCESLSSVTVPNAVSSIGEGTFTGCKSLEEVRIGSSVTAVGADAFAGCTKLKEITLHSAVTEIGEGAFENCGLTAVHIGAGIQKIGDRAFAGNPLTLVAVTAQTPPAAADNVFTDYTATLMVQSVNAESAYAAAPYCWSRFSTERLIEPTDLQGQGDQRFKLNPGESRQLSVTLTPSTVTLPHIFWESSDPSVATVDHNGLVKMQGTPAVARALSEPASCKITARTLYAGGPEFTFHVNDTTTGVDGIVEAGDIDPSAEIFNLSGVRIEHGRDRLTPGIYIIVTAGKAERIRVR